MNEAHLQELGNQLRAARQRRGLTQPELAMRVGRDRARISELERDLIKGRIGRDRLALLMEICDALDLVPMLVPRARSSRVRSMLSQETSPAQSHHRPSVFDEVFVDLGEED